MNQCPDCNNVLAVTEVPRRNCTRVEYRCTCGFADSDFRDIVPMYGSDTGELLPVTLYTAANPDMRQIERSRASSRAWYQRHGSVYYKSVRTIKRRKAARERRTEKG